MSCEPSATLSDKELLDWLEEQVVDVIHLDDGRLIDVTGDSVRKAIAEAACTPVQEVGGTRECAVCYCDFEPEEPGQTECDPLGCPGRGDGEPVQEVDRGA